MSFAVQRRIQTVFTSYIIRTAIADLTLIGYAINILEGEFSIHTK